MAPEPARIRPQQDCPSCGFHNVGFHNAGMELRCQKCGRRLPREDSPASRGAAASGGTAQDTSPSARANSRSIPVASPAPRGPAMPEPVRREIHARVERFKARRQGQTLPLPFEERVAGEPRNVVPFPELESPREARPEPRIVTTRSPREAPPPRRQPAARTSGETAGGLASWQAEAAPPQAPLSFTAREPEWPEWQAVAIAPLRRRVTGHLHDLLYVLAGTAVSAAPFYWIAGQPPLNLFLLGATLCGSLLIALLYGTLFLCIAGRTPGMCAASLQVAGFDGRPATRQQRLLRVAGALVSAGSFLFGYLWAFIDDEQLYWHDHISKTFLTPSP